MGIPSIVGGGICVQACPDLALGAGGEDMVLHVLLRLAVRTEPVLEVHQLLFASSHWLLGFGRCVCILVEIADCTSQIDDKDRSEKAHAGVIVKLTRHNPTVITGTQTRDTGEIAVLVRLWDNWVILVDLDVVDDAAPSELEGVSQDHVDEHLLGNAICSQASAFRDATNNTAASFNELLSPLFLLVHFVNALLRRKKVTNV